MKPKMRFLVVILIMGLVSPFSLFARTRQQVVDDAGIYVNYSWTASTSNLLDTKTYTENGTAIPDISTNTPDSIDDRAQQYTDKYGNVHYSVGGNPVWWPFVAGSSVTGGYKGRC